MRGQIRRGLGVSSPTSALAGRPAVPPRTSSQHAARHREHMRPLALPPHVGVCRDYEELGVGGRLRQRARQPVGGEVQLLQRRRLEEAGRDRALQLVGCKGGGEDSKGGGESKCTVCWGGGRGFTIAGLTPTPHPPSKGSADASASSLALCQRSPLLCRADASASSLALCQRSPLLCRRPPPCRLHA